MVSSPPPGAHRTLATSRAQCSSVSPGATGLGGLAIHEDFPCRGWGSFRGPWGSTFFWGDALPPQLDCKNLSRVKTHHFFRLTIPSKEGGCGVNDGKKQLQKSLLILECIFSCLTIFWPGEELVGSPCNSSPSTF